MLGLSYKLVLYIPFCRGMGLVRSGLSVRVRERLRRLLRDLVLALLGMDIYLFQKKIHQLRNLSEFLRLGFEARNNFVRLVLRRRVPLFLPILPFCLGSILCIFFLLLNLKIFSGMCCLCRELLGFCLLFCSELLRNVGLVVSRKY